MARYMAKYRPPVPIFVCSMSRYVIKQLNTLRGVIGYKIPSYRISDVIGWTIKDAKEMGMCKSGDKLIMMHGINEEYPDESNILKIIDFLWRR